MIRFPLAPHLVGFVLLIMGLGFVMSLGNAAVFKHTAVYYPHHVGAAGVVVGKRPIRWVGWDPPAVKR